MKNLSMLVLILMGSFSILPFKAQAQTPSQQVNVDNFETGRVITATDIELLKILKGAEEMNAAEKNELVIGNYKFITGKTLTNEQASFVQIQIKQFAETHRISPTPVKDPNSGGNRCKGCGTVTLKGKNGSTYSVCTCK